MAAIGSLNERHMSDILKISLSNAICVIVKPEIKDERKEGERGRMVVNKGALWKNVKGKHADVLNIREFSTLTTITIKMTITTTTLTKQKVECARKIV